MNKKNKRKKRKKLKQFYENKRKQNKTGMVFLLAVMPFMYTTYQLFNYIFLYLLNVYITLSLEDTNSLIKYSVFFILLASFLTVYFYLYGVTPKVDLSRKLYINPDQKNKRMKTSIRFSIIALSLQKLIILLLYVCTIIYPLKFYNVSEYLPKVFLLEAFFVIIAIIANSIATLFSSKSLLFSFSFIMLTTWLLIWLTIIGDYHYYYKVIAIFYFAKLMLRLLTQYYSTFQVQKFYLQSQSVLALILVTSLLINLYNNSNYLITGSIYFLLTYLLELYVLIREDKAIIISKVSDL